MNVYKNQSNLADYKVKKVVMNVFLLLNRIMNLMMKIKKASTTLEREEDETYTYQEIETIHTKLIGFYHMLSKS